MQFRVPRESRVPPGPPYDNARVLLFAVQNVARLPKPLYAEGACGRVQRETGYTCSESVQVTFIPEEALHLTYNTPVRSTRGEPSLDFIRTVSGVQHPRGQHGSASPERRGGEGVVVHSLRKIVPHSLYADFASQGVPRFVGKRNGGALP